MYHGPTESLSEPKFNSKRVPLHRRECQVHVMHVGIHVEVRSQRSEVNSVKSVLSVHLYLDS